MISSQRFIALYRNIFKGRSVIELGSGSGLVGIFVSKQFEPTSVCITDLDSYKEHITHNVQLNSCGDNVSIEVFDWLTSLDHSSIDGLGHDDAYEAQERTYDIVLALEW
jgi:tRNA1(Val) A37 N6-methylase TrmN6